MWWGKKSRKKTKSDEEPPADAVAEASPEPPVAYTREGLCPICRKPATFVAADDWYRDSLVCKGCEVGSLPRERALMQVLNLHYPGWPSLSIHESAPAARGASTVLARECKGYIASHFFPDVTPGASKYGFRCENLEQQTFADAAFDLVISQDVMEHINRPDLAFREVSRTLKPGGAYVFTAPTFKGLLNSFRRAILHPDGIEHLHPPEYHGNPVDPEGVLVTFHYGYDLPELIHRWAGLNTMVCRFHDHHIGVIGEFTEVYVCTKEPDVAS
ncbi:MAG: class I SAM-dependent methyltransferase [Rhodospirillales bacterium]